MAAAAPDYAVVAILILIRTSLFDSSAFSLLVHLVPTTPLPTCPTLSLDKWITTVVCPHHSHLIHGVLSAINPIRASGPDQFHLWLSRFKLLCPYTEEDETAITTTPLHRSAPLALFIRRTRLAFDQLAFDETVRWWDGFNHWCEGSLAQFHQQRGGPQRTQGHRLKSIENHAHARLTQDYHAMRTSLAYYDYEPFVTDLKSASRILQPQYALLQQAFMEYQSGGYETAAAALSEAIHVARRANDSACLAVCASLANRSPLLSKNSSMKESVTRDELQSDAWSELVPSDLLWEIKRDLIHGKPLPALFAKLYRSRVLQQTITNKTMREKGRALTWSDGPWESGWQFTASTVWDELGSTTLAKVRERCGVESLLDGLANWETKLPILSRSVTRHAHARRYSTAIRLCFEAVASVKKRRGMGVLELRAWTSIVRSILRTKARHRAQTEMIEYLDRVSPPNVLHWTLKDADDESIPFIDEIETLLVQSQTLIDTHQPTSALPQLLRALHLTDSLSYSSLYLRALLLLIECRLAISPTISEAVRSEEEMEKVWTEILQTGGEGDQVEVLAKGWEMKGRCTIVRAQGKQGGIEAAGVALQESARLYEELQDWTAFVRTGRTMIKLADHLHVIAIDVSTKAEWKEKRDHAVEEWHRGEQRRKEAMTVSEEDWVYVSRIERMMKRIESLVLAEIGL